MFVEVTRPEPSLGANAHKALPLSKDVQGVRAVEQSKTPAERFSANGGNTPSRSGRKTTNDDALSFYEFEAQRLEEQTRLSLIVEPISLPRAHSGFHSRFPISLTSPTVNLQA